MSCGIMWAPLSLLTNPWACFCALAVCGGPSRLKQAKPTYSASGFYTVTCPDVIVCRLRYGQSQLVLSHGSETSFARVSATRPRHLYSGQPGHSSLGTQDNLLWDNIPYDNQVYGNQAIGAP
ncbi:hypothetical protein F5883DRAFT_56822 [Diaporthe sp. PMI_573]|nr:hypothetical protein F5883DRAFT_56822 [Diaporthaceae sp. PMI_573]